MKTKINDAIRQVLQQFGDKYFIEDVVNKNKVIQDLDGYNIELLEAFISNETIKKNFTIDIAGNIVMQTNKLIELFETDEYWQDSYTKYSKKIGLTAGGKFIDESTDVVLDFPYKDTVLKASMSKEDTDKDDLRPDEPFLNEVIAKEEIDVLLDKKILVNAKKYDKDGDHEVDSFSEDDNLIMKGNNLLALHTLKDKYTGKVKLIYIDPPYNTGNDSFKYNDKFNRSTWLTFMKNRLEISKVLLSEEGSIWINIGDEEVHYLKVLMDQLFFNGFVANVLWQKRTSPDARATLGDAHDHILVYTKNKDLFKENLNTLPLLDEQKERFRNSDNDPRGAWVSSDFTAQGYRPNQMYTITTPSGKEYSPPPGRCWKNIESEYLKLRAEGRMWFGVKGDAMPRRKTYLSESDGRVAWTWWDNKQVGHNQEAKKESIELFGNNSPFSTPKPERLIQQVLNLASSEEDIIMDFFMGSSTTQAVAHKMNRRYIGIEQMDYINTVSVPRLQKVIEGEQGGISKEVEWQGGGSFVYVELMGKNKDFLTSIQHAKTPTELLNVFEFMLKEAEIDFRVDLEAVKDTLFELSLKDQKKTLIKMIEKNQLYYNYSEIDDENVRDLLNEKDYEFNKSFYK